MQRSTQSRVLALLLFSAAVAATAFFGSQFNPGRGETAEWYGLLQKPSFNPPGWIFPIVWTALYVLMVVSAYRVWRAPEGAARKRALILWWAQLAFNAVWSPIFFGARRPEFALADLALLVPAAFAYVIVARRVDRAAAAVMLPYLGWISFATVLNAAIVRLNP